MGKSAIKPFNAQVIYDAAKPYIQQAEPYVRQLWTHLEPHHRRYTGHVNTFLHGYEPWQILAIASVATMVLTKVTSSLVRWAVAVLMGLLAVSLLPVAAKLASH